MSIRARILLAYLMMLILPLGLIVALDGVLHSYHRGDVVRFLAVLRPRTPFARVARDTNTAARRINLQILENPDAFASPAFMATLDPAGADLGFVVRRGADVTYRSPALAAEPLPQLPAFAAPPPPPPRQRGPSPPPEPDERAVLGQWDFRFSDGAPGSLFLVRGPGVRPPRIPDINVLLVVTAVIVLAAGNGLITFAVARSMIGPLGALEQAAERISGGDLETPLPPLRRRDEMARVREAFERMRVRLGESLAKQRQYEQSRLELIASISHDLRTPVTTIRGYAEGLRDGVAAGAEKRERYLRTIIDRAVTMDHLIEELFLLSTLELQQAPFAFRSLDLRQFLEDSVEELRRVHEGVPISLWTAGAARVSADPSQLRRVIENVVDNAVRHCGRPDPCVDVRLDTREGRAVVEIRDNGRGIPADELGRVFDRFYRGDQARSGSGSGLGLTIARRIVEAHGGEIHAESPPGGGASIVMSLALEAEP